MKKRILFLPLFMVLTTMLSLTNVKAAVFAGDGAGLRCSEAVIEEGTNKAYMICDMGFEIKEKDATFDNIYNSLTASFTLNNVTLADSDITVEKEWKLQKSGDSYKLETTATTFEVGYHKIATVKFYKIDIPAKCSIKYNYNFTHIDRTCSIYEGKYYGKTGEVNELTYQKECGTNKCVQLSDGTYWGKEGTQVADKEAFDAECNADKTCKLEVCTGDSDCKFQPQNYTLKVGETIKNRYGKDETVVNEEKFNYECQPHYCVTLKNPDTKADEYYNKAGVKVDQSVYEEDCFKHVCSVVNGKYYNSEGKIVETKEEFDADCAPVEVEEKYICKQVDDKFYGKSGEEVTEKEYNLQCKKHSCEIIDGVYFDKDSNQVNKTQYAKLCPNNKEENPNTGSFLPFLPLIILAVGGVGIYFYTKKDQLV